MDFPEIPSSAPLIQLAEREVLEASRREFDYLTVTFRDLDAKAQGTIAISGFSLSAALAFLGRREFLFGNVLVVLLLVAIFALVASAVFAVLALRIRSSRRPPGGEDVQRLVSDLKKSVEGDLPVRVAFFFGDVASLWFPSISERRAENRAKGRFVASAQGSLLIALLAIAVILAIALFKAERA